MKYIAKIARLKSIQVLNSIFSLATPFYEASSIYRLSARELSDKIRHENEDIRKQISYLKRMGYIETFVEGKEKFYELTDKGQKKVADHSLMHPNMERSSKWDGKWRVIIFDIPNKLKVSRDSFRLKLLELGCIKVQESVYVFPFECTELVVKISELMLIEKYVLIMISEIIQGEESIIEKLLDKKILLSSDLIKD